MDESEKALLLKQTSWEMPRTSSTKLTRIRRTPLIVYGLALLEQLPYNVITAEGSSAQALLPGHRSNGEIPKTVVFCFLWKTLQKK